MESVLRITTAYWAMAPEARVEAEKYMEALAALCPVTVFKYRLLPSACLNFSRKRSKPL